MPRQSITLRSQSTSDNISIEYVIGVGIFSKTEISIGICVIQIWY